MRSPSEDGASCAGALMLLLSVAGAAVTSVLSRLVGLYSAREVSIAALAENGRDIVGVGSRATVVVVVVNDTISELGARMWF